VPRALLSTLVLAPLSLLAGAILLGVLMASRPEMPVAQAIAYSSLAVIALHCLGPGSRAPRRQLARVWGAVLPRREAAMLVAVCLGLFALLVFGLSSGEPPDTRPLHGLSGDLSRLRSDIRDLLLG
jgi:hypothetical protein